MITDTILKIVFNFVNLLFSPLGKVSINIPFSFMTKLSEFVHLAMYFLPMAQLMPIIVIFVTLMAFRIIVTTIKTIWDLLPIL